MDDNKKTLIGVISGIVFLILIAYFGLNYYLTRPSCHLDYPLGCHGPLLGPDGFLLNLDNYDTEPIYIQDITISKYDGKRCFYRKKEIVDPETDYYSVIGGQRSTYFFTNSEHIDGECLMKGMEIGNNYEYVLEVVFFNRDVKQTLIGGGLLHYGEENINPFE